MDKHCAGLPRVKIKKGKANLFLEGNPIVYAGAVEAVSGSPATGSAVIVSDWKDCAIAWGGISLYFISQVT